MSKFKQGL